MGEDDENARIIIRKMLEEFGYTVIEAVNGEDAVRKFRMSGESISLILMDVVMPIMNGKDAADAIRSIKQDVKIIFMSGYPGEVMHRNGILEEGTNFMTKPISFNNLLGKVRVLLDAPTAKGETKTLH